MSKDDIAKRIREVMHLANTPEYNPPEEPTPAHVIRSLGGYEPPRRLVGCYTFELSHPFKPSQLAAAAALVSPDAAVRVEALGYDGEVGITIYEDG